MKSARINRLLPSLSWDDCRLLVESVVDYAIFMLDAEGRVATWNRGAEKIHCYRADEAIGLHLSTFLLPEDALAGKAEHELSEARLQGRVEDEGWRVRKGGERFWANVITTALFDETEQSLEANLVRLGEALAGVDPTLVDTLEGSRHKMLYQLNRLRTRFVHRATERDAVLRRRLDALEALLHPQRGLQERTLNVYTYLALAGYGLIEDIGVVVTPGNGYGQYGEGFVRLSITAPTERVEEGARRLREWRP